ncbi:MAG TPA: helix-turn-helix domain-containing protein [Pirellulales bacterium]|nr:helix-turn-helix domain-containing protein [Pirellulales bacterium]
MARKLIDQEEAARMLGITPEQVSVLRDRKKLFPYRDGDQWKFKQEDIERYREEMKDEKPAEPEEAPVWDSGAGEDLENIDLQVNDEIDSILLSEVEMGKSSSEGASTIIGKPDEGPAEELDLPPAAAKSDDVLIPLDDDADILASGGSMVRKTESSLKLPGSSAGDSKNVLSGNSALLKGGSTQSHDAGSSGLDLVGDSALARFGEVKLVPSPEGDKKSGGSSDKLFGSDALQLSDEELKLMEVGPPSDAAPKPAEGSKKTSGSSIKLGDEELEVVVGGSKSGSGSDLTQSPSDSGIQLISASDSGLSLEQPLALGSSARRLLDMPTEGADITEEIVAEAPIELKAEDDFLLTAMDDTGEDSSDSGSQVIALDTDDEMSSGMFAPAVTGTGMLEEEPTTAMSGGSPLMGASSPFAATSAMMAGAAGAAPGGEAPYSTANIALLSVCVVLLMLCGMMTFDLVRNMWSWDGPYPVNSSIMDSIGKTVGWMEK